MLRRLILCAAVLTGGAVAAAPALAATSPTVTAVAAASVGDTTASLRAVIDANGSATIYYFQYGLTTSYGATSSQHSAGHGTKPVAAGVTATALSPGSVYHFRVIAQNAAGQTVGADHTFTTRGDPPPGVTTGPATDVGRNTALLTGQISTNNEATTYEFQYGTTPTFGATTPQFTVAKGTAPLTVSTPISGLEAGALFYYRLVAFHNEIPAVLGGPATFVTEPYPRPVPTLHASTQPTRDRRAPFILTTSGKLEGYPALFPLADACTGTVKVRLFDGSSRIAIGFAPLASDCTFSLTDTLRRLPGRGARNRTVKLKVLVYFNGNGYVGPRRASTEYVTIGRG